MGPIVLYYTLVDRNSIITSCQDKTPAPWQDTGNNSKIHVRCLECSHINGFLFKLHNTDTKDTL